MNAQNPLAFLENYKAIKARLNSRLSVKEPLRVVYTPDDPCGPPAVVRDILRVASPNAHRPTFASLKVQVAEEFGVSTRDIDSPRRSANLVKARRRLWWLGRTMTSLSMPQMGRLTGGRDHTTVLHGLRQYEAIELGRPFDKEAASEARKRRREVAAARKKMFRAEYQINGDRFYIGFFPSREEAKEACAAHRLQHAGAGV